MVLEFSAFLKRHVTAKNRADEAEKKPLEGVEEEAAMCTSTKMRFLSNGPCHDDDAAAEDDDARDDDDDDDDDGDGHGHGHDDDDDDDTFRHLEGP